MAGEKFDVYLSSTKADLEEERALVTSIIQSEFNRTVKHSYSASDQPALESCLADVRSASLYLCIIGRRYGSCPTGHTKSYTHLEFEEACRTGKPIFVFLKAYDALYADDQRDPDGYCSAIEEFRRIANETARPALFRSLDALRTALGVARSYMESSLPATLPPHPPADTVRRKLAEDKVFLALPASLPERWARIEEEIRLQRRGAATAGVLQLLDELWSDTVTWELADDGAPLPTQAINQLTRLIRECNEERWNDVGGHPERSKSRRLACQAMMKLLFALAPHESAWHPEQWRAERGGLPFQNRHMLMAVFNVVIGKNFQLELAHTGSDEEDELFVSKWMLNLDAVEFGIGANRRARIEEQVASQFPNFRMPKVRQPDGTLREKDREALQDELLTEADIRQRVYVITRKIDADHADPLLVEVAHDLGAKPLLRVDTPSDRLRVKESLLAKSVEKCLYAIRNIP